MLGKREPQTGLGDEHFFGSWAALPLKISTVMDVVMIVRLCGVCSIGWKDMLPVGVKRWLLPDGATNRVVTGPVELREVQLDQPHPGLDPPLFPETISFAMCYDECLTMLAPGGYGKGKLMDLFRGTPAISGAVFALGEDLSSTKQFRRAARGMGICLAQSALWENLTPRQHLTYYATVKGVTSHCIERLVDKCLSQFQFGELADRQCQFLTECFRRRVALGIAFIGAPPLLVLEEPDKGLSAAGLQLVTKLLNSRVGQSVLVATSRVDFAEAISDRLGVLVQGKLSFLGEPRSLRQDHSPCYWLHVRSVSPEQELAVPPAVLQSVQGSGIRLAVTFLAPTYCVFKVDLGEIPTAAGLRELLRVVQAGLRGVAVEEIFLGKPSLGASYLEDYPTVCL